MTLGEIRFLVAVLLMALLVGAYVHVERHNMARMTAIEARIMALDQHCGDVKELFVLEHGK